MTSVSPEREAAAWHARETCGAARGWTRGSDDVANHRGRWERLGTARAASDQPATAHGRAE